MSQARRQILDDTLVIRIQAELDDFESLAENPGVSSGVPQRSPAKSLEITW